MGTAQSAQDALRASVEPLRGDASDEARVLEIVGDAEIVLLGEATHGTHEFYAARARITQRLIEEKAFSAVAVEADWPDALRVHRFARGAGGDGSAVDALGGFERFPTWMWRNADVLDFVGWLRAYNEEADTPHAVGFYGLDLYSLYSSSRAVLQYLERVDPDAARHARGRYACFEQYGPDASEYGRAAYFDALASCEDDVIKQLVEMQRNAHRYIARDGRTAEDEYFYAEQNARLVRNAEEYYRNMFRGRVNTWNLRDTHMVDTLDALREHLVRRGRPPRIVVWEHNSHLGDARAIDGWRGHQVNVGQLVRERHGAENVCIVGFTTHHGTVTAASDWDLPAERKRVRPALTGSYEALFHRLDEPRFLLNLEKDSPALELLSTPRLERAIGVVYRPETERQSHYFTVSIPEQFDVVIHHDQTRAVEPLEATPLWRGGELPETFPSAL